MATEGPGINASNQASLQTENKSNQTVLSQDPAVRNLLEQASFPIYSQVQDILLEEPHDKYIAVFRDTCYQRSMRRVHEALTIKAKQDESALARLALDPTDYIKYKIKSIILYNFDGTATPNQIPYDSAPGHLFKCYVSAKFSKDLSTVMRETESTRFNLTSTGSIVELEAWREV